MANPDSISWVMIWIPNALSADRRLGGLPPAVAGDAAFRIFCTPAISERRAANHRQLTESARYHLRNARWQRIETPVGQIQTYTFEPDTHVVHGVALIVHGWSAEASFMAAVAEPIRRAGFRVVLFDLPAHGLSEGRSTNLIDCARATVAIGDAVGPVDAIVTHSFGGLIALVATEGHRPMPHALATNRIVLIASPNRLSDVTGYFSKHWQLDDAGRRAFEQRLERIGGRPLSCFASAKLLSASRCRAFVVHARDDQDVAFHCAEEIVSEVPAAELRAFDGLGHRNILFAPQVARSVTAYLAPPIRVQETPRAAGILPIPQMPPSEPQVPIHYHG